MRTRFAVRRNYCFRGSEEGAALVETAIIMSVLMILIFGLIEFAQIFWTWNTMLLAMEEGGRYAMIYNTTSNPNGPPATCVGTLGDCAVARANAVLAAYPSPNVMITCFAGCDLSATPPPTTMTLQGSLTFDFVVPRLLPWGPITLTSQFTVPLS
jgi:hypothetical protein